MGFDMEINDPDGGRTFNVNSAGMSALKGEMLRRGMLSCASEPTVPDRTGAQVPSEGGPERRSFEGYGRQHLCAEAEDAPSGIPVYKLSSNDGWLVTADECRAALRFTDGGELTEEKEALRDRYEDFAKVLGLPIEGCRPELFAEWIEFIEAASDEYGFVVC